MPIPRPLPSLLVAASGLALAGCWSAAASPASGAAPGSTVQVARTADAGPRLEEILTGRVPGLSVTRRPDGTFSLRMRGSASAPDAEPLVVIDGVPTGGGTGRALAAINPRDVERVEVIRDAASLSLYGVRGAHGVIAITTRSR